MKICLIELMPFPYALGGGTTHLINLGNALVNEGNEVHIISSKPSKDYKRIKGSSEKINLHNVGISHKKFEGSGKLYYLYRIWFEILFVLSALKKLREIKPEIIDCQSSITTCLPASLSKIPFVITFHGVHSWGFKKLYTSKGKRFVSNILEKVYSTISRFNVKRAKRLISQGDATVDHYTTIAGDKSKGKIIPNIIYTDFWKYSGSKDNKLIVVVSRFTKQKALDKLITAVNSLKNFKLCIIGKGELEDSLKSIAGKNISFPGYMPPNKYKEYFEKARFTVVPSEFEGLPYAVLEAMASGVIPITTKTGDLPNLITNGENGFLLDNNNPKSISDALKKCFKKEPRKTIKSCKKNNCR